jgi:predicted phage tail component-like protein
VSLQTFTWRGVSSDDMGVWLLSHEPPILMPLDVRTMDVAGRAGDYLMDVEPGALGFPLPIFLTRAYRTPAQRRELAAWLYSNVALPITFSSEPDKVYYGTFIGETGLSGGLSTLTFYVPNPFARATTADVTSVTVGDNTISVGGKVFALPTYRFTFSSAATFLRLRNTGTGEYLLIGTPAAADQTPASPATTLLDSDCSDLTGWTVGTVAEGGVVAGTMGVSAGKFVVTGYGTNTANWHGPNRHKTLPDTAQDFRLYTRFGFGKHLGKYDETGRTANYVLDVNGNVIAGIEVFDGTTTTEHVVMRAWMGDLTAEGRHFIWSGSANPDYLWNRMAPGRLILSRRGKVCTCQIDRWSADSGSYINRLIRTFNDAGSAFQTPAAQLEVWQARYSATDNLETQYVDSIRFDKYGTEPETPYIFEAGDELVVNFATDKVLLNGELFLGHVRDFGSRFFGHAVGSNNISVETDGTLSSGDCSVLNRWL